MKDYKKVHELTKKSNSKTIAIYSVENDLLFYNNFKSILFAG